MNDRAILEAIGFIAEELRITNLRLLSILEELMNNEVQSIKTITVANDEEGFDKKVNALLRDGWRIQSTSCSTLGGDTHIDEIFQAILSKSEVG